MSWIFDLADKKKMSCFLCTSLQDVKYSKDKTHPAAAAVWFSTQCVKDRMFVCCFFSSQFVAQRDCDFFLAIKACVWWLCIKYFRQIDIWLVIGSVVSVFSPPNTFPHLVPSTSQNLFCYFHSYFVLCPKHFLFFVLLLLPWLTALL